MPKQQTRQPLYERIGGLARRRRSFVLALLALLVLRIVVSIANGSIDTNRPQAIAGMVATVLLLLVLALAAAASRWSGDVTRGVPGKWMTLPTEWPSLNQALEHYEIRTGAARPRAAVLAVRGPSRVADAELVYLQESQPPAIVSPLNADATHTPGIIFTPTMLATYDADELLAVVVHLTERGQLSRGTGGRSSNGVSEADSKTLLLTHDHRALLRAIEKSDRERETPTPDVGRIRFADADLHATLSLKASSGVRWEARDRIAELRNHLGAAALDVPTEA